MKVSSTGYRIASFTTIGKGELILASPRRIPAAGLFSCHHFVGLNKMVYGDHFAHVRKMPIMFVGTRR